MRTFLSILSFRAGSVLLALMFAAMPASAQNNDKKPPPDAEKPKQQNKDQQSDAQQVSFSVKVLSKIHHTNQVEIKAGKLATQKAASQDVRAYGERLMKDHKLADKKVSDLANELGVELIQVKPQTKEEKQHAKKQKETMQKLQELKGEAFDPVFLKAMVDGHKHAIETLTKAQKKLDQPEVKELVGKLIPILKQHLELAENLQARDKTSTRLNRSRQFHQGRKDQLACDGRSVSFSKYNEISSKD